MADFEQNNQNTSLEAEQSLLGSILIDPRCMEDIGKVTAYDFEFDVNQTIFSAIQSLADAAEAIDPVTVLDRMREQGTQDDESRKYVLQLMEITPTAANAGRYSAIVRENSVRRQMAALLDGMQNIGKRETKKRLKELQEQLDAIENGNKWSHMIAQPATMINPATVPKSTFYIEDMLTEGVYFLNGFSKVGKSRLLLQMLLALSTGESFLNRNTLHCSVLYLALEDEHVDYQNRMLQMLQGNPAPDTFLALTKEDFPDYKTPTLDEDGGLIDLIEANIKAHPDIKVIGIDVFTIIRSKGTRNPVADDNRDVTTLMRLASKHKLAIIVAHHVSKTDLRSSSKRGGAIGSGAGTFSLSGTVIGEFELSTDLDHDGLMIFRAGGRRIKASELSLKSNFPAFDYLGNYKEYTGSMDDYAENLKDRSLIETIKFIYRDRVLKSGREWRGRCNDIFEINVSNRDLPPMDKQPNRRSFNESVLTALRKEGILIRPSGNGSGAPSYIVSGTEAIYEQDELNI